MNSYKYISSLILSSLLLVVVSISTAVASEDFIEDTIHNLLREKITDERIIIEAQYNSKKKLEQIKTNQEKVEAILLEKFDPKYSSFRVNVKYNDGKGDTLSGRYVSYVMAPIAAKYIKFGEVIMAEDLTTKKVNLTSMKRGYATEEAEVVGMQAKKYIAVGNMFKLNELSNPPVIKTNDPVNIIYSSGAISLKTIGVAMGTGAVGDTIKIKNSSSGAILLGQIINNNTVRVGGNNE
ncbi:flagellar basal body P-ring formation chaperone FlgA [Rickettsiaceae bacterium]|nr:flagellar basal body P-ring formation chaperone FlgA [Rickettsiaceae bacterium]